MSKGDEFLKKLRSCVGGSITRKFGFINWVDNVNLPLIKPHYNHAYDSEVRPLRPQIKHGVVLEYIRFQHFQCRTKSFNLEVRTCVFAMLKTVRLERGLCECLFKLKIDRVKLLVIFIFSVTESIIFRKWHNFGIISKTNEHCLKHNILFSGTIYQSLNLQLPQLRARN